MSANARAALAAAATVYEGGRGHSVPDHILVLADHFKDWLDRHEPKDVVTDQAFCDREPRTYTIYPEDRNK